MTHYIIPDGKYEQAFLKMPEAYVLPFTSLEGDIMKSLLSGTNGTGEPEPGKTPPAPVTVKNKTKYSCPCCKVNVWGKPNLNLICGNCNEVFQAVG